MWLWEKIGGTGSLGADKIVVAAVFDGDVAVEQGRWDWKSACRHDCCCCCL